MRLVMHQRLVDLAAVQTLPAAPARRINTDIARQTAKSTWSYPPRAQTQVDTSVAFIQHKTSAIRTLMYKLYVLHFAISCILYYRRPTCHCICHFRSGLSVTAIKEYCIILLYCSVSHICNSNAYHVEVITVVLPFLVFAFNPNSSVLFHR